ncbi:MAG TPA: hypothetical protein VGS22_05730 [Thermoanaerobaculia bacterium]|jgi:hypothetical protein|nr:hypothetical protein [Thermoanaerobaculia bacterium]
MSSFRGDFLRRLPIPMSAAWLLSDIAEAKGRQDSIRAAPQVLSTLRETALVQSVESSNRIEGITVAPGRLRPLVLGEDRPRDRSEEEILGYRRALERVHLHARDLAIDPRLLLDLHGLVQEGAGDAGQGKRVDNEIVEILSGEAPRVRFRPSELETRVGDSAPSPRGAKTAQIEAAIARFPGDFTLGDLERACPGASRELARRVLRRLSDAGQVESLGRGPGARWRRHGGPA